MPLFRLNRIVQNIQSYTRFLQIEMDLGCWTRKWIRIRLWVLLCVKHRHDRCVVVRRFVSWCMVQLQVYQFTWCSPQHTHAHTNAIDQYSRRFSLQTSFLYVLLLSAQKVKENWKYSFSKYMMFLFTSWMLRRSVQFFLFQLIHVQF